MIRLQQRDVVDILFAVLQILTAFQQILGLCLRLGEEGHLTAVDLEGEGQSLTVVVDGDLGQIVIQVAANSRLNEVVAVFLTLPDGFSVQFAQRSDEYILTVALGDDGLGFVLTLCCIPDIQEVQVVAAGGAAHAEKFLSHMTDR